MQIVLFLNLFFNRVKNNLFKKLDLQFSCIQKCEECEYKLNKRDTHCTYIMISLEEEYENNPRENVTIYEILKDKNMDIPNGNVARKWRCGNTLCKEYIDYDEQKSNYHVGTFNKYGELQIISITYPDKDSKMIKPESCSRN